jgi:hypothetical protein
VASIGDNYFFIFSPISQTVKISYSSTMTAALVWDWLSMQLVGVPKSASPAESSVPMEANQSMFLGTFVPGDDPQLLAVSGASFFEIEYKVVLGTFALALYRAAPGLQAQVALHSGDMPILDVAVSGGGLDYAGYERTNEVYIIQVAPTSERITISVRYKYTAFLPCVIR